jgi:hypothetical protein
MAQRRTRSQLTLPDDLLLSLPHKSPLKIARAARTVHPDGQLHLPAKRSISPPDDEGTQSRHSEPPPAKRAKNTFGSGVEVSHRRTHASSDPNAGRARRSIRKPVSLADARGSVESEPWLVNGRAQSVPLFPASYSYPFIDFKNLLPSPRRARSRSPGKEEQKLFEPTKLDVAVDESEEKMDVEEDVGSTIQEAPQCNQPTSVAPQTIKTITTDSNASSAISPQRNSLANQYAPSTPAPSRPDLLVALSPLTPLYETPQSERGNGRREPAGRANNSEEFVEVCLFHRSLIHGGSSLTKIIAATSRHITDGFSIRWPAESRLFIPTGSICTSFRTSTCTSWDSTQWINHSWPQILQVIKL